MAVTAMGFLLVAACACGEVHASHEVTQLPRLEQDAVIATDGYRLPLSRWLPENDPCRVVLGLHGFNDFRKTFNNLASKLSEDCTAFYAYDQRGFGETTDRGEWAGRVLLANDAILVARLLHKHHPQLPLYLLGESMGGAVALLALTSDDYLPVDGAVLLAPAVWGYELQPWYQRLGLWLGIRVMPNVKLSSEWIGIDPSDDPEVLEYWRSHPMIIHEPTVAALYGVTGLMGAALAAADRLQTPTLILYGGKDEVMPQEVTCALLNKLPDNSDNWRFVFYPDGYHMLTRYSGAETTIRDIRAWLESANTALPSGGELQPGQAEEQLCGTS